MTTLLGAYGSSLHYTVILLFGFNVAKRMHVRLDHFAPFFSVVKFDSYRYVVPRDQP
jgi:hypothetical protein